MMDQRLTEVGVVDEKQLKLLMRDWRRGRADRNCGRRSPTATSWCSASC